MRELRRGANVQCEAYARAVSQAETSSRVTTLVGGLLGLALIAGFGYLLIQATKEAPAVVASIVTATGAVVAVVAGRVWEKRQALQQARRERIAPSYSGLVEMFWGAMHGQEVDEQFFHDWTRNVLLWGPEPVIVAFNAWRASLPDEGEDVGLTTMHAFERMLYSIRDDLGNPRGKLGEGDLLRMFINDYDEFT